MRPARLRRSVRSRVRERGVAVITALLLTTLAVAIVASLFWQQQVQVRSMENQRLQLQTKWILRGALDWSKLVLDTFRGGQYTGLDQPWATPLAETRLDQYIERERIEGENFDATLSGSVTDASSRYNLTNLATARKTDDDQVDVFKRLLRNLQMQDSLAVKVASVVAAGQTVQAVPPVGGTDDDGGTRGTGGTGGAGGAGGAGGTGGSGGTSGSQTGTVQGSPIRLLQVDDLLSVPGFTQEMVERLRPFVIVLPQASKVNVNTAPAEVLAALMPNMSVSEANTLVAERKRIPWRDINMFSEKVGNNRPIAPNAADVTSEWFLVDSRIRLDRAALDAQALIHRPASGMTPTRVVWIRQN